jgi:hypothetical protein
VKYDEYAYLWPPRPECAVPFEAVGMYVRKGWWAQVKKNGTCTVIAARGDEVIFKTRHATDHDLWRPLPEHAAFFQGSPRWTVFAAELLHSKTPHIKNELFLFDVLVHDGEHLVGSTFAERQRLLHTAYERMVPKFRAVDCGLGAYAVGPYVRLLRSYAGRQDAEALWRSLKLEDEGLVLKDPHAKLKVCITGSSNGGWQVKVRRPTKNYSF